MSFWWLILAFVVGPPLSFLWFCVVTHEAFRWAESSKREEES